MKQHTEQQATYFGAWALVMWALEPLIISEVSTLPIFELLAIFFTGSFLVTLIRLWRRKRWHVMTRQPLLIWVVGIIGICGSDFAYIRAAQMAPIAHVDLIDYLWPCCAVFLTGLLPRERLSIQHLVGSCLSFLGVYWLTLGAPAPVSTEAWAGYALAFGGTFLWAAYSVFSRYHKGTPTEMVGLYCGIGAVISLALHCQFEHFVIPTLQEGGMTFLVGVTGAGIAYQLWDHGVKYGSINTLSVLTYVARLIGMLLLVVFNKEPFTANLLIACLLTSLGVVVSSLETSKCKAWKQACYEKLTSKTSKPEQCAWQISELH